MSGDVPTEEDLLAEQQALHRIVNAMRNYESDAELEVLRWERNYEMLPERHKRMLPNEPKKFRMARECISSNMAFIQSLLQSYQGEGAPPHLRVDLSSLPAPGTDPVDMDKVRYVLKNLARDWSEEGAPEREETYGPLLEELERVLPVQNRDSPPAVLVPGAGLGRLCLECVRRGYACQGNEFSYYMLLTSSYMLNKCKQGAHRIHPWVHTSLNHFSDADQLRHLVVPEVDPGEHGTPGMMSMCAGDFLEVYAKEDNLGQWDAVLSCFFLDTAHNFIEYLEVIYGCLVPGGVWVNLGPLLYHWADAGSYLPQEELSIESSWEVVRSCALQTGFQPLREEVRSCTYTTDRRSMMQTVYRCALTTMVKPSSTYDSSVHPPQEGCHS